MYCMAKVVQLLYIGEAITSVVIGEGITAYR